MFHVKRSRMRATPGVTPLPVAIVTTRRSQRRAALPSDQARGLVGTRWGRERETGPTIL